MVCAWRGLLTYRAISLRAWNRLEVIGWPHHMHMLVACIQQKSPLHTPHRLAAVCDIYIPDPGLTWCRDPLTCHEMGVLAFKQELWSQAEGWFLEALNSPMAQTSAGRHWRMTRLETIRKIVVPGLCWWRT